MKLTVITVFLIGVFAVTAPFAQSTGGSPAPGARVPDFVVSDLTGRIRSRSELQKEASESGLIMLTFWCTSCHSCRDIDRKLDKIAAEYKGKAAVFALGSNASETAAKISAFKKTRGLTIPALLDPGAKVADLFGVKVTTTTIIIDGNGVVRYRGQFGRGQQTFAEEALKALVAGKEVALPTTQEFG